MEHKDVNNIDGALLHIRQWAEAKSTQEMCGFLGFDKENKTFAVTLEDNIANDPENYFAISPVRFLKFKTAYDIAAVWHSHVYGDAEPSMFDEVMAQGCQVPFLIYSCQTKQTGLYKPENSKHGYNL